MGDTALEIGPGLGALTAELLASGAGVIAVESDKRLVPWLRERFAGEGKCEFIEGDVLRIDLRGLIRERGMNPDDITVVSNLPFSISTPLIGKLLLELSCARLFVLTVQRELAVRIKASPGGKKYGAFTVFCRCRAGIEMGFVIPPSAFFPRPGVHSELVVFRPLGRPRFEVGDEKAFHRFVQRLFSQRRKMVKTILRSMADNAFDKEELVRRIISLGIDPSFRPERLSPGQLARLYTNLMNGGL